MKLHNVSRKHISYVELERDGKTPIGISVKDGTKYNLRPLIKNIKYQSLSQRSHCVAEGDVILSICNEDSKGMGKKDVRRRLKEADSCIELKLEYEIREACLDNFGIYRYERMSLNIKKESGSFGFILRKNDSSDTAVIEYPTITNIQPGGPADKERKLKDGDRLLKIDDQSLSWLSLQDVSNILRKKEKATFLVEYNIRIVDFCIQAGEETEIEIDCLDTDLGMVLGLSKENCKIFIQEIRQGSLAQRCGAFHVGDVILRINDIDEALLTVSKANSLIQRFRKHSGKLVFIPQRREGKLHQGLDTQIIETKKARDNKFSNTSTGVDHLRIPSIHHSQLKRQPTACNERISQNKYPPSTDSYQNYLRHPRISTLNHPLFNSPSSLHKVPFVENNLSQTSRTAFDVHEFQSKTISMFRDIMQNISNMQHFISFLDNEAERIAEKDADTSEIHYASHIRRQGFPNIDSSRFSQLKAICTQMKNSAYTFSMHLVRNFKAFPWHIDESTSPVSSDNVNGNCATNDLIHYIMGDLTEINIKQFVSSSCVDELIGRLYAVELDCWECRKSCLSASFLTQKILLLTSNEPDPNMLYVIRMLTENLMKLNIPCDDCKRPWCSVSQTGEQTPVVQNIPSDSHAKLPHTNRNIQDTKTINTESSLDSNCSFSASNHSIGLDLRSENAFYNLRHIHSDVKSTPGSEIDSNSDNVSQDTNDTNRDFAKHLGVTRNHFQNDVNRDWANHSKSLESKVHRDKNLVQIPMQTWKSSEVYSDSRYQLKTPNLKRVKSDGHNYFNNSEEMWHTHTHFPYERTAGHPSLVTETESDRAETSFSSDATTQTTSSNYAKDQTITKTQSSTTVIKLINDGSGFGLNFEFNTFSNGKHTAPVITAVHSQSAAHKCGIIVKGDRVLEINGQTLVGLAGPKIEAVMKQAFAGTEVLLKVEFDIAVPEIQFGTFDIRIDKNIKPGLEFKEFRKSSPLVVKGVVKGSAAHRSGLLFPGDEILFTNCIRQESYESCTCMYKRSEMVIFTVRREPKKDLQDKELGTGIEHETIPSGPKCSISKNFILYRTLFRTEIGNEGRMLDHELTLFRDPIHKDFGFLFGQNPDSGKVYISGIKPGGPADQSEVMKKNDQILEVNGTIIGRYNKNHVLSIFMQDNDHIDLITRRVLRE